jgi:hypothetical protein
MFFHPPGAEKGVQALGVVGDWAKPQSLRSDVLGRPGTFCGPAAPLLMAICNWGWGEHLEDLKAFPAVVDTALRLGNGLERWCRSRMSD